MYRVTREGDIRQVTADEEAVRQVEVETTEVSITARLISGSNGDGVEVRVSSTGLIDGERLVNRTFLVTEKDDLESIQEVLQDILDKVAPLAEQRMRRDAQDDYDAITRVEQADRGGKR